jgi:hypothetical protein
MSKTPRIFIGVVILFIIGLFGFVISSQAATTINSGDLIKASGPAVYYYGADSKRYVFPNQKTYLTWYANFSGVKVITDSQLANITIGGNVTYKPGVKLVKITTDPKVYAVDAHGTLRWIANEDAARGLYGASWTQKVEDLPDAFFVNYKVGEQINKSSDFSFTNLVGTSNTINEDKSLVAVPEVSRYASSLGLGFLYWANSCGDDKHLEPSCEVAIKVYEKTTDDGSEIIIGSESKISGVEGGVNGDVTIEIHKIPTGRTAEAYARELVDKIVEGSCYYTIQKTETPSYTTSFATLLPTEVSEQSWGSCFTGLNIGAYRQYDKRPDLLIGIYHGQDPFLGQDEINMIFDSMDVVSQ